MAQLYSTGPALFYVGIPLQWNAVVSFITNVQQQGLSHNPGFQGPANIPYQPPKPVAGIINTGPPAIQQFTTYITQLGTVFFVAYLGTVEEPPEIEIVPSWDEIETDQGGTEQASDRLSEGEEAIIAGNFTRFNEAVYLALAGRAQPNPFLGGFPGWSQIGRAMYVEQITLPLWVVFPYTGKTLYGLAGQPPGYRFYNTLVEGPDRLRRLGSTNRITALQFRAQRLLTLVGDTSALLQPYVNYADIPILNPIAPTGKPLVTDPDDSIGGLYDFDLTGVPNPD